jgi:hypothetical protein
VRALLRSPHFIVEGIDMAGLLWGIIVILFIFWLLGFTLFHLGSLIHIVIVVAVILLIFNLITGRGARV